VLDCSLVSAVDDAGAVLLRAAAMCVAGPAWEESRLDGAVHWTGMDLDVDSGDVAGDGSGSGNGWGGGGLPRIVSCVIVGLKPNLWPSLAAGPLGRRAIVQLMDLRASQLAALETGASHDGTGGTAGALHDRTPRSVHGRRPGSRSSSGSGSPTDGRILLVEDNTDHDA